MQILLALLLGFSLIFLANLAQARGESSLKNAVHVLFILFNLPLFLVGLALLLLPPDRLEAAELGIMLIAPRVAGVALILTSVWGLLVTLPEIRRLLSRWLPLDPDAPVHTLALIFAGYLVGHSVFNLTQGGIEGLLETSSAASIGEVVASEALYASLGLAGVGLFIRREGWKLLSRLGLEKPTKTQIVRSLRWVAVLLILQWIISAAFFLTDPDQAEMLRNLNTLLLGDMDTVGEWFILAFSAAVGEEILFRGALQPVFGLWLTSIIFAFAHIQYGFTPATALVFLIGLVLGLVRRQTNTTVAIFVHFSYNFILGLLLLLTPYLESLAAQ